MTGKTDKKITLVGVASTTYDKWYTLIDGQHTHFWLDDDVDKFIRQHTGKKVRITVEVIPRNG